MLIEKRAEALAERHEESCIEEGEAPCLGVAPPFRKSKPRHRTSPSYTRHRGRAARAHCQQCCAVSVPVTDCWPSMLITKEAQPVSACCPFSGVAVSVKLVGPEEVAVIL